MPDEEWIKTLEDGRQVKFIYQELPGDAAFITAQIEGNEAVERGDLKRLVIFLRV